MSGGRKRGEPTSQRRAGEGGARRYFLGQRRRTAGLRREPAAGSIGREVEGNFAEVFVKIIDAVVVVGSQSI